MDNISTYSKVLFSLIFFLIFSSFEIKAENKITTIKFRALDKINNKPPMMVNMNVYNLADTTLIGRPPISYSMGKVGVFLEVGKKYLLEIYPCEMVNIKEDGSSELEEDETYERTWTEVDLSGITDDNFTNEIHLPNVYFQKKRSKKPQELKELTVTASRIMFYHKGDTLVYRADAFVLAEGSMLDALLEQLPGVELRSSGEIVCNGRKIDNLLLNGRDLFNGKKELMLDNLAAYTVKNIAVYDKTGYSSELMGQKIDGDVKHVMDVRLKKQYASGWIMNADVGYGTHNRYLGKLFGMWYGDFASLATYANINNLSDTNKPGEKGGSWSREQSDNGVKTQQNAGLIYTMSNRENTWELKGDLDFAHTDENLVETMRTQTYMLPTDMFGYGKNNYRNKNISISTNHTFRTKIIPRTDLYVNPKFEYNKFDNQLSQYNATFNRDIAKEVSEDFIADIYESNTSNILNFMVNRIRLEEFSRGHNLKGSFDGRVHYFFNRKNKLSLYLLGDYINTHSNRLRKYDLQYGGESSSEVLTDHQYFKQHPNHNFNINPSITYSYQMTEFYRSNINFGLDYSHIDNKSTSDLYSLESASDFGVLPSMSEFVYIYDPGSSYSSHTIDDSYKFKVHFQNRESFWEIGKSRFLVYAQVALILSDRSYDYINRNIPTNLVRRNILYEYHAKVYLKEKFNCYIEFAGTPIKVRLTDMMNIPQTDPLNIYRGNKSLKDSYAHRMNFYYKLLRGQTTHSVTAGASLLQNAQARSYEMDPETGVRTFSTHNVQGNWNANAGYNYFTAFGQNRNLDISSNTRGTYVRNVDMVGGLRRRKVSTVSVGEEVKFNWKLGSNRLSAFGDALWHRYLGNDEGFTEFSAWNMKYGVSGVFNLPYNWGVSTDVVMYTRGGYADRNLNTTDVVWNARVSKSLLKGSVVLALDAYDILRQISTVSYMVNAQARTETVVNSIPSYFLFHIYYRFNKQPKRK